jgi:hypothetical protein
MGKELHIGMGIALIGVDDTNRNNDKESLVNKVVVILWAFSNMK